MIDNVEKARSLVNSIRWHHKFEVVPGVITPGTYRPDGLWSRINMTSQLKDKRVLDIGARDGFFSFKCEENGADVVAVDYVQKEGTGFSLAAELRDSKVKFINQNLYTLNSHSLGKFDVVLFLGVIYHVPDPYLALEIVRSLTKVGGLIYVESTCIDNEMVSKNGDIISTTELSELPIMIFAGRNMTSFWDFNSECLRLLLQHTGFRILNFQKWGKRMLACAEAVDDGHVNRANVIARGTVPRG